MLLAYPQLQGLRDALDEATLERQSLATELERQRERERRKLQQLQEQLMQKNLTNSSLEKVSRDQLVCAQEESSRPLPSSC